MKHRVNRGLEQFSKPDFKTEPNLAKYVEPKPLPSLPELPFNGDGTLALGTVSDGIADSNVSREHFIGVGEGISNTSASTPAIPRKSSKRRSARPNTTQAKLPLGDGDRKTATQGLKGIAHVRSSEMNRASAHLQLNREFSKTMSNSTDRVLLQGPYLVKGSFMENKLITKMKTAMNSLGALKHRSRRDSTPEERLLDSSNSELREWEDAELRSDEGKGFAFSWKEFTKCSR
jgi:hypothetical protein